MLEVCFPSPKFISSGMKPGDMCALYRPLEQRFPSGSPTVWAYRALILGQRLGDDVSSPGTINRSRDLMQMSMCPKTRKGNSRIDLQE